MTKERGENDKKAFGFSRSSRDKKGFEQQR
jgi:hypothetical protein